MELGQKPLPLFPRLEVHLISFNRTHNVICLFISLILLAGCTGSDLQVSMPTHTTIPSSPTPLPPTQTASPPTQIPQPFEAVFDGIECTHSGPAEVSAGEYSILLKNLSNEELGLWTGLILDGHTYQDLLDLQSEPGKYYRKPEWLVYPTKTGFWDEPNDDKVYTFLFSEAGEYVIDVGWSLPESLWFCGSFWVVEE